MTARALGAVLSATLALTAPRARADEARLSSPRHVLETSASIGLAHTLFPAHVDNALSTRPNGATLAVDVTYRTPYFLAPFLDLQFVPLYAADTRAVFATGPTRALDSAMAFGVVAGPSLDFGPLRARAGLGGYDLIVHSTVLGQTVHAAEFDFGYAFSLGGVLVRRGRFRMGVEARLVLIVDASFTAASIGTTIGYDALRF
jgi:hypothetical protein